MFPLPLVIRDVRKLISKRENNIEIQETINMKYCRDMKMKGRHYKSMFNGGS